MINYIQSQNLIFIIKMKQMISFCQGHFLVSENGFDSKNKTFTSKVKKKKFFG